MNKASIILFFAVTLNLTAFGQSIDSTQIESTLKQYGSISIVGHSIFTFNYERSLINWKQLSVLGEIGIGLAEFSESSPPNISPSVLAINLWVPIQYSFKCVALTACVSPTLYKAGNLGFIDLNGTFGVRINFSKYRYTFGPFLGIYYCSKIYRTVSNPESIYLFTPVSVKFGLSF